MKDLGIFTFCPGRVGKHVHSGAAEDHKVLFADAVDQCVVVAAGAGGGDTVAALNKAGAADRFTYISTAGGAFLEWMEGKTLPGVAALEA